MESIEPSFSNAAASPASMAELQRDYADLRRWLCLAVTATLVLAASVTLYLWYQFLVIRREVLHLRPQVEQMSADFEKNQAPVINGLYSSLTAFGKTNPDFNIILARYGLLSAPSSSPGPWWGTSVAGACQSMRPPHRSS